MKMHLVDGDSIPISPELAAAIGINHAAVMQQLHFLLTITQKTKRNYNFVDGEWWVYNSYEEWIKDHFKWMGRNAIVAVFSDLEKRGLVISRKGVKSPFDRKKWYRINYTAWEAFKLSIVPNPNDEIVPNRDDDIDPIPNDVFTDTTAKTTTDSLASDDAVVPTVQKSKPRNPVFDAVALHLFSIDPNRVNGKGGRIGAISSWLEGKNAGMRNINVGFISEPATADDVTRFATWYKCDTDNKLSMPQGFTTFVEWWHKWETAGKPAVPSSNGNGLNLSKVDKASAEQDANESHLRKLKEQQERMEARHGHSG